LKKPDSSDEKCTTCSAVMGRILAISCSETWIDGPTRCVRLMRTSTSLESRAHSGGSVLGWDMCSCARGSLLASEQPVPRGADSLQPGGVFWGVTWPCQCGCLTAVKAGGTC
jgi:hypothetical protein